MTRLLTYLTALLVLAARVFRHGTEKPTVCDCGDLRICIGCGWIGQEDDCLDWKHPTGARMCPECHDNTERYADESDVHTCGACGAELQIVRPGKYQCPRCE